MYAPSAEDRTPPGSARVLEGDGYATREEGTTTSPTASTPQVARDPSAAAASTLLRSTAREDSFPIPAPGPVLVPVPAVLVDGGVLPPVRVSIPHNPPNSISRVVTTLVADAWEEELQSAGVLSLFHSIPVGIRDGFDIGLDRADTLARFSSSQQYTIYDNHSPALRNAHVIEDMIKEESAEGRISKFYKPEELYSLVGPFRNAPLTVAPKDGDYARGRVCQDFSHPRNDPRDPSFNSSIDMDEFACDWGTFSQCYVLAAQAPDGTEVAVFDVKAAHRRIPVLPWQQAFYVIAWMGLVALNFCCQFGAASSSGLWGRLADAFRVIFLHHFPTSHALNWADDFIFWRYRRPDGLFDLCEDDIYRLAARLGWPWSRKKTKSFASRFNYLGFTWDLRAKTVEITPEKKAKYLRATEKWTAGGAVTLKEAQSVLGKLVHCGLVLPEGRSRLRSVSKFTAAFQNQGPRTVWKLPKDVIEDVAWWRRALGEDFCGMPVQSIPEPVDRGIFVDASTGWGLGLVMGDVWDHWKLVDGWKCDGRDIGWAEMLAIEFGILALLEDGIRDEHVLIRSDNKGVVGALDAGSSRSVQSNRVLQRIVALMLQHNIWLSTEWVASADNTADAPSRGLPVPGAERKVYAFKFPYPVRDLVRRV